MFATKKKNPIQAVPSEPIAESRKQENRSALEGVFHLSPIPSLRASAAGRRKWFGKQEFRLFDVCPRVLQQVRDQEADPDPIPGTHPALLSLPGGRIEHRACLTGVGAPAGPSDPTAPYHGEQATLVAPWWQGGHAAR